MSCIVGECPVCKDWVYETEWSGPGLERYGKFIHKNDCYDKFIIQTKERKIIRRQDKEIRELRAEIERLTLDNSEIYKQLKNGRERG